MSRLSLLLVVAGLLALAVGCSESTATPADGAATTEASAAAPADEQGLVGTWAMVGKDGRYVFNPDHSGELALGSIQKTFTWSTDGDVVSLTITGEEAAGAREMHYAIADDGTLELRVEGQTEPSRFERR